MDSHIESAPREAPAPVNVHAFGAQGAGEDRDEAGEGIGSTA